MSLKTRLARLEQHCAPEPVLGVQIDDGPVTAAGEEMTLEAFHERYPAGEIGLCVDTHNWVGGGVSPPAPTPPRVRVCTGRFPIAEQHRSIKPSTSTPMLLRLARLAGVPGQGTLRCQGWLLTTSVPSTPIVQDDHHGETWQRSVSGFGE